MKRDIISSAIEYQGISIIKKDIPILEKILKKNFSALQVRQNPHVCLDYFGIRKQSDTHIIKTQEMFHEKTMGRQIKVPIIGIGYYEQMNENGTWELMNVSLLVDDSSFDEIILEGKSLTEFNKKNMPWITLYTNPKTVIRNDKEYPVATAKHSGKCFGLEELEENERNFVTFFDNPVMVMGELCVFRGNHKYFHVINDTTRLVTWKSIREEQKDMLATEFMNEAKQEEKNRVEEIHKHLTK